MKLFPAIDILDGRAVRLLYGKRDRVTDYGDPVDCAKRWIDGGAEILHVVNLNGAFGEEGGFNRILEKIAALGVPVQSGGGLRSLSDVEERFSAGACRAVLGTVCVTAPEVFEHATAKFGDKIVAGLDARGGLLAVKGWTETAELSAYEFGKRAYALGVRDAVFTDVSRDGALTGVNVRETVRMAETGLNIIASGGVSSLADLRELKACGVYGAVLGRAIYTGDVDFAQAASEVK
ncbi:MAG: 1-(5-phosphoribosyl)-5-((5-phosphoribosylamino)methylideneamino)imidazole-4-carboxamide isomerase [Clostridia bacterium]|nr:1-(5-phosphoribosyl)-5-((5-phosphoribosylamino)methylideneamino)imidazole-4-carboxamide isomerase [Clostridia bacterium]